MKSERMKVLDMLESGKINADEAYRLLEAMDNGRTDGAGGEQDNFAREFADLGAQFRDWGREFGASFKDLGAQFRGWGGEFNQGFKDGQGKAEWGARAARGHRRGCRDE
ncbi:MAG: hypothetical protein GKR89_29715 [Candidatus Latescibacteria bacterium]|nr:hypothetical protein [Candidatus Latescibacterota bacterium]